MKNILVLNAGFDICARHKTSALSFTCALHAFVPHTNLSSFPAQVWLCKLEPSRASWSRPRFNTSQSSLSFYLKIHFLEAQHKRNAKTWAPKMETTTPLRWVNVIIYTKPPSSYTMIQKVCTRVDAWRQGQRPQRLGPFGHDTASALSSP